MSTVKQYLLAAALALFAVLCASPIISMFLFIMPWEFGSTLLVYGLAWAGCTIIFKYIVEMAVRGTEEKKKRQLVPAAADSAPAVSPELPPGGDAGRRALRYAAWFTVVIAIGGMGWKIWRLASLRFWHEMHADSYGMLGMMLLSTLVGGMFYLLFLFLASAALIYIFLRIRTPVLVTNLHTLRKVYAICCMFLGVVFFAWSDNLISLLILFGIPFLQGMPTMLFYTVIISVGIASCLLREGVLIRPRQRTIMLAALTLPAALLLTISGPDHGDWSYDILMLLIALNLSATGCTLAVLAGLRTQLTRAEQALYLALLILSVIAAGYRNADGIPIHTFNLKGKVRLADSSPVPDATITLCTSRRRSGEQAPEPTPLVSCVTDNNGQYFMAGITERATLREYFSWLGYGAAMELYGYRAQIRVERPGYASTCVNANVGELDYSQVSETEPFALVPDIILYADTYPVDSVATVAVAGQWRDEYMRLCRQDDSPFTAAGTRWQEFLRKYPGVPVRDEVESRILTAQTAEAQGRFYLSDRERVDNYRRLLAEIARWRKTYPAARQMQEMLVLQAELCRLIPDPAGCEQTLRELRERYPDGEWHTKIAGERQ